MGLFHLTTLFLGSDLYKKTIVYIVAVDPFLPGYLKGVGRMYLQSISYATSAVVMTVAIFLLIRLAYKPRFKHFYGDDLYGPPV